MPGCLLVVRFLCVGPLISGSNPPSAQILLKVKRVASSPYFQAYESLVVVTSRGRTWTLLAEQKAPQNDNNDNDIHV